MPGLGTRTVARRRVATPRVRRSITESLPTNTVVISDSWPWSFAPTFQQFSTDGVATVSVGSSTEPVQSVSVNTAPTLTIIDDPPVASSNAQETPIVAVTPPAEPREQTLLDKYGTELGDRMSNTVCKYKGKWVYVARVTTSYYLRYEPGKIQYYELEPYDANNVKVLKFEEAFVKDFEFDQHKLGYMNYGDTIFYVTKQLGSAGNRIGLCIGQLSVPQRLMYSSSWYTDPGFVKMLTGQYDSEESAWSVVGARIIEKPVARAISNKAAIFRKTLSCAALYYMGEQVGEVLIKKGTTLSDAMLYPSAQHLVSYFRDNCGFTPGVYDLEAEEAA